nr:MAG TPA: hypothetical protein [Caudoviricetes sp.]
MSKIFKKVCDVVCGAHQLQIIKRTLYILITLCVLLSPLNGGLLILAVIGCVGMAFVNSEIEENENK